MTSVDCREIREYLPSYVDAATGPRASAIDEHLKSCGDCRAELGRYREMIAELEGLLEVTEETPGWALDRIMDAVGTKARQLSTLRGRAQTLANPKVVATAGVFAAGVAGAVALQLMRRRRRRTMRSRLRSALAGA
jgi:predicted anti-sigma-YlaC factor YlaD